jgi:hypothetical protein
MSHVVQIQTQVRDPVAVTAACRRLSLPEPVHKTVQLYSSSEEGLTIQLPGWQYPIVCDLEQGSLKYDNFEGRWGEQRELDRFLQAYAVEKACFEARKQGHAVTEQPLADGSIKLAILVGG